MANKYRKVWKVVSRKVNSGKQTWPGSFHKKGRLSHLGFFFRDVSGVIIGEQKLENFLFPFCYPGPGSNCKELRLQGSSWSKALYLDCWGQGEYLSSSTAMGKLTTGNPQLLSFGDFMKDFWLRILLFNFIASY
jgi:hypothetical protein